MEAIKSLSVKIDTVNPTVSAAVSGTSIKTVTLTAADATSGVASIEYQIGDSATWTTYSTPLTFSNPGTYVVRYRAIDKAEQHEHGRAVHHHRKEGWAHRSGEAHCDHRHGSHRTGRSRRLVHVAGHVHPHGCRWSG